MDRRRGTLLYGGTIAEQEKERLLAQQHRTQQAYYRERAAQYGPKATPSAPAPAPQGTNWLKTLGQSALDWATGLPEWGFNQFNENFLQKGDVVEPYTPIEEKFGPSSMQYPSVGKMASPAAPNYTIAEVGDTYETLGDKWELDPTEIAQLNPDISAPTTGGAVNLTQPPTPTPDPKVHLDTGDPISTPHGDIVYPEGWNMAKLKEAIYGGGGVIDFASKYYGGDYTKRPGEKPPHPYEAMTMEYATAHPEEAQRMYEDYQASFIPTEELPAWPGLPSSHAWEKNAETGEWIRKPHEAVFDELYIMNGIDPTNPDEVEWFWSLADNDLLFAGELFDVIEWDTGTDYGGYGSMPTPSRQYGRGQKPSRGDYASYLQLSSWSI